VPARRAAPAILNGRAAEAAEFIAQKKKEETKNIEKLDHASELFHKIYLVASLNFSKKIELGLRNLIGIWTSSSCKLALEERGAAGRLVGTLEKSSGEYDVEAGYTDNLLSGEATSRGSNLSILSFTVIYKFVLAFHDEGKLVGLIYTDEKDPAEVTMLRQG
jgi:hypothetical protein